MLWPNCIVRNAVTTHNISLSLNLPLSALKVVRSSYCTTCIKAMTNFSYIFMSEVLNRLRTIINPDFIV